MRLAILTIVFAILFARPQRTVCSQESEPKGFGIEWEFPDAAVRFFANTPPGHTGIVLWNKRLYQMKTRQSETQDKEKRFNILRELD
jgi:hypothetical protein